MGRQLAVSFVHGYSDLRRQVEAESLPALWIVEGARELLQRYPFPRTAADFQAIEPLIAGVMPLHNAPLFEKLPRFGLTGLASSGDYLYAGSWNGVYQIRKRDFELVRIITNPLMNDMHGIWADENSVITILTGKDTVVISDLEGKVMDHFSIANDLTVFHDSGLDQIDWRFVSKQFRGATGLWHFNYVQRLGNEVWLTARNLGAFVVVDLQARKAHLRTMNQKTAVLLHDGVLHGDEFFFTSIDAKIIVAAEADKARFNPRESVDTVALFTRDLVCEVIRIKETAYGREPNWCRGIACRDDEMYVTIDGLYGSDLSFGLLGLRRSGEQIFEKRLRWADIGSEQDLKYVTGFDVLSL